MKILYFFKLIRPVNILIVFLSVIIAIIISLEKEIPFHIYFLASLSAALTAAAGNIINDYYDLETDKINKPDRPLANGKISKTTALLIFLVLNITSLVLAAFVNFQSFIIVVISQLLLFIYSYKLKQIPAVGNITVAFLTGFVFIYGGAAVQNFKNAVIPALFAFLINMIREIVKDIEDIKGDSAAGIKTIPLKYGINFTKQIIFSVTVILIFFTFQPFIFNYYKIEFFIIVMVFVNPFLVYFLKSLFEDQSAKNMHRLSNLLKLNMLTGLIAIYTGR